MIVVLDTNVIVSALKSSVGASFRIIELIRTGAVQPAVTAPLVFEYDDVCHRPALIPHLSAAEVEGFLDWLVSLATTHRVHFLWRPFLRDPKDDLVLEAAVAARADFLVTHNVTDFAGAEALGVRVVTPAAFIQLVTSP